jgi:signal transduction histidine kinase
MRAELVALEKASSSIREEMQSIGHGEKARILVVDDENGPRQALRMLLKEEHEVRLAADVPAALKILEQEPINLVITDLRMPQQSGVELLQIVKQLYPETQVIILTGYAHLDSAMQAVQFGAFAYIEKPFDNMLMLQRVEESLAKYRMEHEHRVLERLAIEANRFETLGRLVAGIIHDMGTPLSVVGSQIELILGNPERGDLEDRLKTMQSQVRHCSEMVRAAMNFLRYEHQPSAPFSLNHLLDACLEVAQPVLRNQRVQVVRKLTDNLPSAIGDLVLVRQAVLNLITNACHAMAEQEPAQEITLETWTENGSVFLAVEDSGPGIPEQYRSRIYDTFFTTKGRKGTGLGLAVVRNVMNRHKGSIMLVEKEGRGARFELAFPEASSEAIRQLYEGGSKTEQAECGSPARV